MCWAIIKKELKFIIPLTILAIIILAVYARGFLNDYTAGKNEYRMYNLLSDLCSMKRGIKGDIQSMIPTTLSFVFDAYLIVYIVFAIIVALIQFMLPAVIGNWKFVIFRPVTRNQILLCMMLPAMFVLYFSGIIFWLLFCNILNLAMIIPVALDYQLMICYAGAVPIICYLTVAYVCLGGLFSLVDKLPIVFSILLLVLFMFMDHHYVVQLCIFPFIVFVLLFPMVVNKFIAREY